MAVKTKQNTKDPPGLLPHLSSSFFFRVQVSWRALSSEHPTLKPVQLHRILTQYQLTAEIGPVPAWQPSSEDEAYIYRTGTCVNLVFIFFVESCDSLVCRYKIYSHILNLPPLRNVFYL